jgi:hypothetical protein
MYHNYTAKMFTRRAKPIRITSVRISLLRPWTEVQYVYMNHLVVSPTAVMLCLPANFLYSLQLYNHSVHTDAGNSN